MGPDMRIGKPFLIAALVVLVIGACLVYFLAQKSDSDYKDLQYAAARRMEEAESFLKERIVSLGIPFEDTDLNSTGLIGPEFTELTSTPGDEKAKRSALNPLFSAAMVRYFHEAGLEKGSVVAVGASGSFPGFVIAVLTAATEMELDTRLIVSCGASMHGATRVEYNVFDIVGDLLDAGLVDCNVLAVSPGSANDKGGGVFEDFLYFGSADLSVNLCKAASARFDAEFIYYDDLAQNIAHRKELYGDDVDLFVNIGGAAVNNGTSSYSLAFPQGLVMPDQAPEAPSSPTRGLNYEFSSIGVPVINLLNVKLLCQENGITFDPVPLPSVASFDSFDWPGLQTVSYNKFIAFGTLAVAFGVLAAGVIVDVRKRRILKEGCK